MTARRAWAWPLVPLYALGLAVKDGLRRVGVLRTRRLGWPVVSVGSLSAGGAGKTPVVIALAELLRARGWDVDVLSRGYGREGRGVERVDAECVDAARRFGDEPVMIARRTGVPVWVGAERFAAGEAAERFAAGEGEEQQKHGQNAGVLRFAQNDNSNENDDSKRNDNSNRNDRQMCVHLLDDGFQHRGLARAVDVVVVTEADLDDALLPAGNRRERLTALRRAHVVVLREEERERVMPAIQKFFRGNVMEWTIRRQISFPDVTPVLFSDVPNFGYIVFSAIARPANFVDMLKQAGVHPLEGVVYPDHHVYTQDDVGKLIETLDVSVANGFVTTEKDAVKLSPAMRERLEAAGPLVVARLKSSFANEADVVREIEARLR